MYGSQPPHYGGGYQNQNPPQPEWRPQQSTSSAPYNPSTYGPINPTSYTIPPSSAPGVDTASWDARYNQHMTQGPPPPLPPRNNDLYSSPSPPPPPPRPTSNQAPLPPPPPPAASWDYTATYTQPTQNPPPRPPVPQAYQNEMQQSEQPWQATQPNFAPQYSHHPPTHHYEPSAQSVPQTQSSIYSPVGPDQAGTNYYHAPSFPPLGSPPPAIPTSAPPVSAPAQPTVSTTGMQWTSQNNSTLGASLAGHSGVSDWEHYSPTPGNVNDLKKPNTEQSALQNNTAHTPLLSQTMTPSSPDQNLQVSSPTEINYPSKTQVAHQPTYLSRSDSAKTQDNAVSPVERVESIDGVIKAWSQHSVSPILKPQGDTDQPSPTPLSIKPATPESRGPSPLGAISQGNNVGEQAEQTKQTEGSTAAITSENVSPPVKYLDPYDDLDPWSKSSLFRYVTMLRKEAVAESEEEKYKIFTGFTAKETRLREVLYNVETVDKDTKSTSGPTDIGKLNNLSQVRLATPVKPVTPVRDDSGLIPVESEADVSQNVEDHGDTNSDDIPYSPGGRPILNIKPAENNFQNQSGLRRSASNPQGQGSNSLGSKYPVFNQSSVASGQTDPAFRSTSVPPTMNNSTAPQRLAPLVSEPPVPAYTPFRYAEGPQHSSENLNVAQPGYQAYSALRQASIESGRAMSAVPLQQLPNNPDLNSQKSSENFPIDETFLGIIREKSVSYRGKSDLSISESGIEELGALIPDPFPTLEESVEISSIKKKMDIYSDDFRYIYVTTENWELSAKDRREKLEKDRLSRQEASESHIDSLFNEKEIGYADINPLEEEFRQTESRTQLEEERKELDSYIRTVYNPLDTRLKEEIVELKALYQRALDQLSHDTIYANTSSKYQISHAMKIINTLVGKLEARYQKRLDLGLDREHHRKKAERRPLVFLGDSRALKKLDADFEKMEKQNIVEAAKDRDERANKLTDVFDEAILYALGNHQRVLDDTAAKVRKLDVGMVERSNLSAADKELLLRSISALTKLLAEDAESLLMGFKEADTRLNEADYNVSVAEAQYAHADPEVFRQLEEEKKKEDDKIQEDNNSKLESIKKAPAEISAKIDEILLAMHKEPGTGTGPWRRPTALIKNSTAQSGSRSRSTSTALPSMINEVDEQEPHPAEILMPGPLRRSSAETEQQERLRKALEDAKKRNAAKNYTT